MSFSETKLGDGWSTSATNQVTDESSNKSVKPSQLSSQDSGHEDRGSCSSTTVSSSSDDRVTPPAHCSQTVGSIVQGATVYKVSTIHTDHSVTDLTDDLKRTEAGLSNRKSENDRHKGVCALKSSSSYDLSSQKEPHSPEERAWSDSDADTLSKDPRIIRLSKSRSFLAKYSDSKEIQEIKSTNKVEKTNFSKTCYTPQCISTPDKIEALNPELSETGLAARAIVEKDYGGEVFNYGEENNRDGKQEFAQRHSAVDSSPKAYPKSYKVTSETESDTDFERKQGDLDIQIYTDDTGSTHLSLIQNTDGNEEEQLNDHSAKVDSSLSDIAAAARLEMEADFSNQAFMDGTTSNDTSLVTSCEELADPSFFSTSQKPGPVPLLVKPVAKPFLFPVSPSPSTVINNSGTNIDQALHQEKSSENQTPECSVTSSSAILSTSKADTEEDFTVTVTQDQNGTLEIENQHIKTTESIREGGPVKVPIENTVIQVFKTLGQNKISGDENKAALSVSQKSNESEIVKIESTSSIERHNEQNDTKVSTAKNNANNDELTNEIKATEVQRISSTASVEDYKSTELTTSLSTEQDTGLPFDNDRFGRNASISEMIDRAKSFRALRDNGNKAKYSTRASNVGEPIPLTSNRGNVSSLTKQIIEGNDQGHLSQCVKQQGAEESLIGFSREDLDSEFQNDLVSDVKSAEVIVADVEQTTPTEVHFPESSVNGVTDKDDAFQKETIPTLESRTSEAASSFSVKDFEDVAEEIKLPHLFQNSTSLNVTIKTTEEAEDLEDPAKEITLLKLRLRGTEWGIQNDLHKALDGPSTADAVFSSLVEDVKYTVEEIKPPDSSTDREMQKSLSLSLPDKIDDKAVTLNDLQTTIEHKRVHFNNSVMVGTFVSGSFTNYIETIEDDLSSNDSLATSSSNDMDRETDLGSEHINDDVHSSSCKDLPVISNMAVENPSAPYAYLRTRNDDNLEQSALPTNSVVDWLEGYLVKVKDYAEHETNFLKSEDLSDDSLENSTSSSDHHGNSPGEFPTLLDVTDALLKVLSIDKQLPNQVLLQRCSSSAVNLTRHDSLLTISSVLHELLGIQSNHELKLSDGNVVGTVEMKDTPDEGQENSIDKVSVLSVTNLFERLLKFNESFPDKSDIYEGVKLAFNMFQHYLTFEKITPSSASNSDCVGMSSEEDERNVENFSVCERILSSEVESTESSSENEQSSDSIDSMEESSNTDNTKTIPFTKAVPRQAKTKSLGHCPKKNSSSCETDSSHAGNDTKKEETGIKEEVLESIISENERPVQEKPSSECEGYVKDEPTKESVEEKCSSMIEDPIEEKFDSQLENSVTLVNEPVTEKVDYAASDSKKENRDLEIHQSAIDKLDLLVDSSIDSEVGSMDTDLSERKQNSEIEQAVVGNLHSQNEILKEEKVHSDTEQSHLVWSPDAKCNLSSKIYPEEEQLDYAIEHSTQDTSSDTSANIIAFVKEESIASKQEESQREKFEASKDEQMDLSSGNIDGENVFDIPTQGTEDGLTNQQAGCSNENEHVLESKSPFCDDSTSEEEIESSVDGPIHLLHLDKQIESMHKNIQRVQTQGLHDSVSDKGISCKQEQMPKKELSSSVTKSSIKKESSQSLPCKSSLKIKLEDVSNSVENIQRINDRKTGHASMSKDSGSSKASDLSTKDSLPGYESPSQMLKEKQLLKLDVKSFSKKDPSVSEVNTPHSTMNTCINTENHTERDIKNPIVENTFPPLSLSDFPESQKQEMDNVERSKDETHESVLSVSFDSDSLASSPSTSTVASDTTTDSLQNVANLDDPRLKSKNMDESFQSKSISSKETSAEQPGTSLKTNKSLTTENVLDNNYPVSQSQPLDRREDETRSDVSNLSFVGHLGTSEILQRGYSISSGSAADVEDSTDSLIDRRSIFSHIRSDQTDYTVQPKFRLPQDTHTYSHSEPLIKSALLSTISSDAQWSLRSNNFRDGDGESSSVDDNDEDDMDGWFDAAGNRGDTDVPQMDLFRDDDMNVFNGLTDFDNISTSDTSHPSDENTNDVQIRATGSDSSEWTTEETEEIFPITSRHSDQYYYPPNSPTPLLIPESSNVNQSEPALQLENFPQQPDMLNVVQAGTTIESAVQRTNQVGIINSEISYRDIFTDSLSDVNIDADIHHSSEIGAHVNFSTDSIPFYGEETNGMLVDTSLHTIQHYRPITPGRNLSHDLSLENLCQISADSRSEVETVVDSPGLEETEKMNNLQLYKRDSKTRQLTIDMDLAELSRICGNFIPGSSESSSSDVLSDRGRTSSFRMTSNPLYQTSSSSLLESSSNESYNLKEGMVSRKETIDTSNADNCPSTSQPLQAFSKITPTPARKLGCRENEIRSIAAEIVRDVLRSSILQIKEAFDHTFAETQNDIQQPLIQAGPVETVVRPTLNQQSVNSARPTSAKTRNTDMWLQHVAEPQSSHIFKEPHILKHVLKSDCLKSFLERQQKTDKSSLFYESPLKQHFDSLNLVAKEKTNCQIKSIFPGDQTACRSSTEHCEQFAFNKGQMDRYNRILDLGKKLQQKCTKPIGKPVLSYQDLKEKKVKGVGSRELKRLHSLGTESLSTNVFLSSQAEHCHINKRPTDPDKKPLSDQHAATLTQQNTKLRIVKTPIDSIGSVSLKPGLTGDKAGSISVGKSSPEINSIRTTAQNGQGTLNGQKNKVFNNGHTSGGEGAKGFSSENSYSQGTGSVIMGTFSADFGTGAYVCEKAPDFHEYGLNLTGTHPITLKLQYMDASLAENFPDTDMTNFPNIIAKRIQIVINSAFTTSSKSPGKTDTLLQESAKGSNQTHNLPETKCSDSTLVCGSSLPTKNGEKTDHQDKTSVETGDSKLQNMTYSLPIVSKPLLSHFEEDPKCLFVEDSSQIQNRRVDSDLKVDPTLKKRTIPMLSSNYRIASQDVRTYLIEKELMESQCRRLQVEVSTLKSENKHLNDKNSTATARSSELQSEVASLTKRLEETKARIGQEISAVTRKNKETMETKLDSLQRNVIKLTKENDKLHSELIFAKSQSVKSGANVVQTGAGEQTLSAFTMENAALKEELSEIKRLLNQSEAQVISLEEQKRSAEVNLTKLTKFRDYLQQYQNSGQSSADKIIKSLEKRLQVTEERFYKERCDRGNTLSELEEKLLAENSKLKVMEQELTRQLQRAQDRCRHLDLKVKDKREENMNLRLALPLGTDIPTSTRKNSYDLPHSIHSTIRTESKLMITDIKEIMTHVQRDTGFSPGQEVQMVCELWRRYETAGRKLVEWEQELFQLKISQGDITTGLQNLREMKTQYEEKIQQAEEEVEDILNEKNTLETTYRQQLSELVSDRHEALAKLQTLEDLMAAMKAENDSLRTEISNGDENFNETIESYKADLAEMASCKDGLDVQISQLERENQGQKSQIDTLRSELKVKERSLDDLTRELEVLDKKLNEEDNSTQREMDLLQEQVLDLQSEAEIWKNKYNNLCEENIKMEEKVVAANQQAVLSKVKAIETDERNKTSFEQELDEREAEVSKLSNQYQDVESELEHAKQNLLVESKHRTEVENHLSDLQGQLEEKQKSLERQTDSEREQSKQYDSLKGALDSVIQELRKSQVTVKRLQLELTREKDKTSQLHSSIEHSSYRPAEGQITPENITATSAFNNETTPNMKTSPRIQTSPDILDLKQRDLQRERDSLKQELSESLESIESQRGEISELHNRLGVINQQLRSERDTLCQLTADKSDLQQHLQSCIEERDEIYQEKEVSDHDLIKLEENLHDVITKFDLDARGRHGNFQSNYPNVGPEAKKVVAECFSLRLLLEGKDTEIGMLTDKLGRQNQETEFSRHKLEMLMEENLRNRADISRQTAELTNKIQELSSSNEVNGLLVDERSRLQMELHQIQTELDREKDYIERRNSEVADILKKFDESSFSQKTTQQELHKLDNKTAVLETDLRHANGTIAQLETENRQSKAKLERQNEDIRSLTNANTTLEKNLEIEKHMVSDGKSTINKLQDDLIEKTQQLEYVKHEKAMLLNNLDGERKTVVNLQTQLQSKQGEITTLTEEVKQLTLQLDAHKGKLLMSQESYENVCKEKQNIYTDYQEMCKQLNEKEKILTENQVMFNTSLENIQKDLSMEKANLETDRSTTSVEKETLRDEIRDLKEKVSQKEVQLCTFGRTLQELEEMTKQSQLLEEKLMKMTSAAEDTKILINSHRTEIMTLRETHKTLEENYSKLEAKHKSQEEEFRSKRDNHSEQTFELKQTIGEMKTSHEMDKFELKEKLNRTESQLETSQSNLKTLQDSHKEIQGNSQSLESGVQDMKSQIHQLTAEKQILANKLAAFEARFENTHRLCEESISKLRETQMRHTKTEHELEDELNKSKKLKKDLSELEATAFVHESSIKAKQEQVDMLQSEVNKLRQVLETQRQQLASKYKKTAFDLKQQMNDHELEKNRLSSQCDQITANLEQAREQITVKSRENLKLQEDLFNMEAQLREASSKLRQTQETLRQEEEQQSKLTDRNQQQDEELKKLRSFVSKKAETDGIGEGKMSWTDVNRFMQELNSKMDSLKSEKNTNNDTRDSKNSQRLRKHLSELETELHTEKALHQITRSNLQASEDDCQRLRRQLRSKQRTSSNDDRSEKSRMEKINEIIAKSQTQAQLLLATGGYYDYSSSRDVSLISPRSVNHSPDNSLLDHHLHFNMSHNNNNMASTPSETSPVTSTSPTKN